MAERDAHLGTKSERERFRSPRVRHDATSLWNLTQEHEGNTHFPHPRNRFSEHHGNGFAQRSMVGSNTRRISEPVARPLSTGNFSRPVRRGFLHPKAAKRLESGP